MFAYPLFAPFEGPMPFNLYTIQALKGRNGRQRQLKKTVHVVLKSQKGQENSSTIKPIKLLLKTDFSEGRTRPTSPLLEAEWR